MREILFRGRDEQGQWQHGNLVRYTEDDGEQVTCIVSTARSEISAEVVFVPVDENTVGQYVGLKDCDGMKIYEGDIVRIEDNHSGDSSNEEVKFFKGVFGIDNWTKDTRNRSLTTMNFFMPRIGLYDDEQEYKVKVIGNIYDNKELLSHK